MTLTMKLQDVRMEGMQAGAQEGTRNTLLANVKALMKTMNLSAEKAMDALEVPGADREDYLRLLEQ